MALVAGREHCFRHEAGGRQPTLHELDVVLPAAEVEEVAAPCLPHRTRAPWRYRHRCVGRGVVAERDVEAIGARLTEGSIAEPGDPCLGHGVDDLDRLTVGGVPEPEPADTEVREPIFDLGQFPIEAIGKAEIGHRRRVDRGDREQRRGNEDTERGHDHEAPAGAQPAKSESPPGEEV